MCGLVPSGRPDELLNQNELKFKMNRVELGAVLEELGASCLIPFSPVIMLTCDDNVIECHGVKCMANHFIQHSSRVSARLGIACCSLLSNTLPLKIRLLAHLFCLLVDTVLYSPSVLLRKMYTIEYEGRAEQRSTHVWCVGLGVSVQIC